MQLTFHTVIVVSYARQSKNLGCYWTTSTQTTKSQLQTVLITASGPQALNALVHRKRYTQGSRQNRCVSSQYALALRARVSGTGGVSAPVTWPTIGAVALSGVLTSAADPVDGSVTASLRLLRGGLPLAPRRVLLGRAGKIANSELLTAGNPTV